MATERNHLYGKLKRDTQAHFGARGYSINAGNTQPTCWINFPKAKKMGERSTDYDLAIAFHRVERQMEIRLSARKKTGYEAVLDEMKAKIPQYEEELGYALSFGAGEPGRNRIFALHSMPLEIVDGAGANPDDYAATVDLMKRLFDDFDRVLVPDFAALCKDKKLDFDSA